MNMNHAIWAIVPAAGIGKRMQSDIAKQYLPLDGRPVLEYTVNTLLLNEHISGIIVAFQADDAYWPQIKIDSHKPVLRTKGGNERADSVLNALDELERLDLFNIDDWVMVHDAVRPCLQQRDINKLISDVGNNKNGGLLALPVRDTMKRQQDEATPATVASTINRENLWHALTPQYFPAIALKNALLKAKQENLNVTDESSAMEMFGFSPRLVTGDETNIKITRPDDLKLAALYLSAYLPAQL
jgi:2-C-methyl-D-erythritol 4-phosphate cytidylyltransferase